MAARNLVVENFDQLVDSALNELGNRYQHNECSDDEEENPRKGAIEKLPDEYEYEVNAFSCNFKIKVQNWFFKYSFEDRQYERMAN